MVVNQFFMQRFFDMIISTKIFSQDILVIKNYVTSLWLQIIATTISDHEALLGYQVTLQISQIWIEYYPPRECLLSCPTQSTYIRS